MSETITARLSLKCWRGERGTYHLVILAGEQARLLGERALLDRLEFGRRRGFGSIKVTARIGATIWRTSVFPQRGGEAGASQVDYVLLVGRKVMRAEGLASGDRIELELCF